MTKSRILYLAILLVAMTALAWDKISNPNSLSTPQTSSAQTTADPSTIPPDEMTHWINSPYVQRVLNHQKQSASKPTEPTSRNLFVPSEALQEKMQQANSAKNPLQLAEDLLLTSISIGSDKDQALINGQIIKVGQTIGPARLIQINQDNVVLHIENEHITLPIGKITSSVNKAEIKKAPGDNKR